MGEQQKPEASKPRAVRSGSSMSSKQMARAAVKGQRVTFSFEALTDVTGYLVGMDDFHWLVIDPHGFDGITPETLLVHKGSAAIIKIHTEPTLSDEPVRALIERVGSSFWEHCNTTYLGKTPSPRQPARSAS